MTTTASAPREVRRAPRIVCAPQSPIADLARTCQRIARSDATILLTGEPGTGKEVFARMIHASSARAAGPLVAVSCGAIPEALLESELFGHVRGAFTGANQARRGRIAAAEGGTLFLDEIGELPLALQVRLLRVLEERSYEPVGASEPVAADFRLVAATNRDLGAEVQAGRFRRDLYYRLDVCPVQIPPLRARGADVMLLFRHFWEARGERRALEPAVIDALQRHDWPGNVRELENLVERLSVCAEGHVIRASDLPTCFCPLRVGTRDGSAAGEPSAPGEPAAAPAMPVAAPAAGELRATAAPVDLAVFLRRVEDACIDAALARTGGNKKAAADLLGLQRTTLVEKLRRRNRVMPLG